MQYGIARTPAEVRTMLPADVPAVVVVPVYNAYEDVVRCYQAVLTHTPIQVPLLILDDAGEDRRVISVLDSVPASDRPVVVLQQRENRGFVIGMNDAFDATARADVVLVNSDVVVAAEWFERLRDAAHSSSTVGTASTFTNHGTILSLPERNISTSSLPGGLTVDEAASRVATSSPQLRPTIPTAVGHCTWFRRSMLDVVGAFDPVFSPGYSEEVDLCQRAVASGFQHVVADDVFVYHRGSSSFGRNERVRQLQEDHDRLIKRRYPYYFPWVVRTQEDDASTLAASILAARVALVGLRVGIDAMCLGPETMGTQVVVLETIRALSAHPGIEELVVFIPPVCPDRTRSLLSGLPSVTLVPIGSLSETGPRTVDVMYRPYQVNVEHEMDWLAAVGKRVVVNQLDLIAFHNPAYFPAERWPGYRDLARRVGATADGLAFISTHAAADARREGLYGESTPSQVVYCGTEHRLETDVAPTPPPLRRLPRRGFVLCLGASYLHKNRPFAIEVWRRMRAMGWDGDLVLAGPTPPEGSSLALEAALLLEHPELADGLLRVGSVSEPEKAWLLGEAALVLYPTVSEGFGLVPFEAARLGVPTLSSRQGSLDEVLPPDIVTLTSWDLDEAASLALRLINDPEVRSAHCDSLRSRGDEFSWDDVADRLHSLFLDVVARPARSRSARHGEAPASRRRRPPPQLHRSFSWTVRLVADRPPLKQAISPSGSRRERAGRAIIRTVGSRL